MIRLPKIFWVRGRSTLTAPALFPNRPYMVNRSTFDPTCSRQVAVILKAVQAAGIITMPAQA